MIQFQKLKVCAGVQSAPRFESGGTSGRPKIYLLENWSGVFSNKIPKLGHVLSRLLQDIRNDPDRQGAQSNSSTLATQEVLRKHVQMTVQQVKDVWRKNMMERLVDGTPEKSYKDKIII